MQDVGVLEGMFNVDPKGVALVNDPVTQQQMLSFQFALTVPALTLMNWLAKNTNRRNFPEAIAPGQQVRSFQPKADPIMPPASEPARSFQPKGDTIVSPSHIVKQTWLMSGPPGLDRTGVPAPATMDSSIAGTFWQKEHRLFDVITKGDVAEVQSVIENHVDVNCAMMKPYTKTPLHHALEVSGNVEIINALLQAGADINLRAHRGKTPFHFAIQQYMTIPPLVLRLLIHKKADFSVADAHGVTPLDSVRMIGVQLGTDGNVLSDPVRACARQLLNEVTENPTCAIGIIDAQAVKGVFFCDVSQDKLLFYTNTFCGFYDVKCGRIGYIKKLKQRNSFVEHVAINQDTGTIAVCVVDIVSSTEVKNMIIVWGNGQLQDEQPLVLTTNLTVSSTAAQILPPRLKCSQGKTRLIIHCRLSDGQICCWCFNAMRSQLEQEEKLPTTNAYFTSSSDGRWLAVQGADPSRSATMRIYRLSGRLELVCDFGTRPTTTFAIIQRSVGGDKNCLIAMVDSFLGGRQGRPPLVSVFSVTINGLVSNLYSLQMPSPVTSLSFCNSDAHLLSLLDDGSAILINLADSKVCKAYDKFPNDFSNVDISNDRKRLLFSEGNHFRIHRLPEPALIRGKPSDSI